MNKCNSCGLEKNNNEFGKDKRRTSQIRTICKECTNLNNKIYRDDNPDKVKKFNKKYYETHPDVRLNYTQNNLDRYLFLAARKRAQKENLEFNITLEDIIIPNVCPVLGIPLFKVGTKRTFNSPSIDRIDNSKGYIKGNVVIVSWRANSLKKDASLIEIQQMANFYRNFINE